MTDTDRLLEVLKDGKSHSHHELYKLGMIVHSRVADLRAKGHNIVCTKQRAYVDHGRPHYSYFYRLVGALDAAEGDGLAAVGSADDGEHGLSSSSQLSAASNATLDEYGVTRAVRDLNAEFPRMLIENDRRLADLQTSLFGEEAA